MPNRAQDIFKPQFQFGMDGVSLGNDFNKHADREAEETLEAAWAVGVRYSSRQESRGLRPTGAGFNVVHRAGKRYGTRGWTRWKLIVSFRLDEGAKG